MTTREEELEYQLVLAHRENMAIQEMLAHALHAYGKPVCINREDMTGGKFDGKRINIEQNHVTDQFIVSLVDE